MPKKLNFLRLLTFGLAAFVAAASAPPTAAAEDPNSQEESLLVPLRMRADNLAQARDAAEAAIRLIQYFDAGEVAAKEQQGLGLGTGGRDGNLKLSPDAPLPIYSVKISEILDKSMVLGERAGGQGENRSRRAPAAGPCPPMSVGSDRSPAPAAGPDEKDPAAGPDKKKITLGDFVGTEIPSMGIGAAVFLAMFGNLEASIRLCERLCNAGPNKLLFKVSKISKDGAETNATPVLVWWNGRDASWQLFEVGRSLWTAVVQENPGVRYLLEVPALYVSFAGVRPEDIELALSRALPKGYPPDVPFPYDRLVAANDSQGSLIAYKKGETGTLVDFMPTIRMMAALWKGTHEKSLVELMSVENAEN